MLVYPQLSTGALCQFPLRKVRRARTVSNRAADGSTIKLADPAAEITEWQLEYSDLSDDEAAALRGFFASVEGTLIAFTFMDPAGNLLASTENFSSDEWQREPMLTVTAGDGFWHVANGGGAGQALTQTLEVPGAYDYCLSAYARSTTAAGVGLIIGGQTAQRPIGTSWTRVVAAGTGAADAESMRFGVEVPAGTTVDIFGMQVEPQNGASAYKSSTRGGVYEGSHLASDDLRLVCTGVNRNSCRIHVIHANHI
jgi:hypothetical protein